MYRREGVVYPLLLYLSHSGNANQQGTTAGRQLLKKAKATLKATKATGQQKQGYRKTTKAMLNTTSKASGQLKAGYRPATTGFDADGNQWWRAGHWNMSSPR